MRQTKKMSEDLWSLMALWFFFSIPELFWLPLGEHFLSKKHNSSVTQEILFGRKRVAMSQSSGTNHSFPSRYQCSLVIISGLLTSLRKLPLKYVAENLSNDLPSVINVSSSHTHFKWTEAPLTPKGADLTRKDNWKPYPWQNVSGWWNRQHNRSIFSPSSPEGLTPASPWSQKSIDALKQTPATLFVQKNPKPACTPGSVYHLARPQEMKRRQESNVVQS